MSKDTPKEPGPPEGVERRKGDRRQPGTERRSSDRVVTEAKPRRQNPGRRNVDK